MYYSRSKNQVMDPRDMHTMHIENVLRKDLREDTLTWEETNELTEVYIARVREERERLNRLLKISKQSLRLLVDLYVTPRVKESTDLLSTYRDMAESYARKHGRVSADKFRQYLVDKGHHVNGKVLSQVFRDRRFIQDGYRRSTWGGARGRYIDVWKVA